MAADEEQVESGTQNPGAEEGPPPAEETAAVEKDAGEALAEAALEEAAEDPSAEGPKPGLRTVLTEATGWRKVDAALVAVLLLNLAIMGALMTAPETKPLRRPPSGKTGPEGEGAERSGKRDPGSIAAPRPGARPLIPRHKYWTEAWKAAEKGDHARAVALLRALLKEEPGMAPSLRRTVHLQLAHFYGLAGEYEEMRKQISLAEEGIKRALIPEDLWNLGEEATALGNHRMARRYYARFLLQEAQIPKERRKDIPLAYLRLADGYRNQASKGKRKEEDG